MDPGQREQSNLGPYCLQYSKTCLKHPHSKRPKIGFQDQLSLNAGQKYCRCSKGSILQYFRPSLCYHLSLKYLFCLFLSGRLRQVLLYKLPKNISRREEQMTKTMTGKERVQKTFFMLNSTEHKISIAHKN